MSATTDLGKVGITVDGTWSGSVAYEKNSIVNDGADSYISIQDVPIGTALSNTAYWTLLCNGFSSAEVISAVNAWLVAHPEATTTVEDGAVTTAKLADGAVTDAKLAQTGGVLETIGYGFYRTADITGDLNDADVGISRVTATAGHNPSGKVGFVITMARTAGSKAQIFVNEPVDPIPEKCRLFARFLYNNNWSAWVEFADKTDILDTVWINGTDYSGDLNSAPNGFTRVAASATNNPAGDVGHLLTMQRASTAKAQIFWNNNNFYYRISSSGTWGTWQSVKRANTDRENGYTFGDSLMAQDGKVFAYDNPQYNADEIGKTCVGWQTLLSNEFGVSITNYAVGGQGIAGQKPVILSKTYTGIDFVIISVGVNDYSNAVQLGQLPTSRNATFTNGLFIDDLCESIEYILSQNPKTKILLFTPCQRDTTWRNNGVPDFSKSATDIYTQNSRGLYLKDYADAIKEIGRMYSCVVCDMYAESGLNYLTLPEFTFEGVHPTNAGYLFTSRALFEAFKKI